MEFGDLPAVGQHDHTIADGRQFLCFGGAHDQPHPPGCGLSEQSVDGALGPDINTLRRLVEHEDRWCGSQPAGDDGLLLVTTTERVEEALGLGWTKLDAFSPAASSTAS